MESTAARLGSAIEREIEYLAAELGAWLGAAGLDPGRVASRGLLGDLAVWLRRGQAPAGTPPALTTDRARQLARSFVYEFFKGEGLLAPLAPAERHDVEFLLDGFFAADPVSEARRRGAM
jgi:hypothetical protein